MPKVTKSSSETKSNAPVVSAPIVAAPAAKAEKNVKAPKVKAESRSVATPAPTPAPVPLATEANAADDAVEVSDDGLAAAFNEAFAKLQQVTTMLSALKTDFRQLEKRATRELKVANKQSAKRRRKSGNRSPSGFVKPTLISPELASFLGKTTGTEMARTEVTREINAYIRKNNLQDKENGRKINPDSNLSKLLKLKADDELTYFNLQRYMSPHFAKTGGKTSETH
jgi:chromatin remodeling complex protein RSC6